MIAVAMGAFAFVLATRLTAEIRLLVAGDTLFLAYLAMMAAFTLGSTKEGLRRRAETEDEGIRLIAGLTFLAIAFSLFSILTLLNRNDGPDGFGLALAIVSVPLGWLTLHTMAAQHYANVYYSPADAAGGKAAVAGGLDFPGDAAPDAWDFLYFSFVIGMTAQVSDVEIKTSRLRRIALAHSVASFFFNTVLVAVAVNAAVVGAN